MKLRPNILISLSLITVGCGQSKDHLAVHRLKDDLDASNEILTKITDQSFRTLGEDLTSIYMQGKTDTWRPKIRQLRNTGSACITYMDGLSNGKAKGDDELTDLLTAYQKAIQTIEPGATFRTDSLLGDLHHTDDPHLKNAILSTLKNEVLTSEYNLAKYCSQQFAIHRPFTCEFLPTAIISSTRVRQGDVIQLRAWIGDMYTRTGLEMTTRGITVRDTTGEPLEYTFIAKDPPGTYDLPIQLHYNKPDGTMATVEKTFKYTILK